MILHYFLQNSQKNCIRTCKLFSKSCFFFCGAFREGENGIISAAVKIDVVLPVTSLQHPASKRFVTHSPPLSRVISAPQKMGAQFVPLRVGFSFSVLPQECYTNNGPAKVNAKSPPFSKTVN